MSAARPFLFEVAFDDDDVVEPMADEPAAAPTFDEAALQAARAEGFDAGRLEGYAQGQRDAEAAADAASASAREAIAAHLTGFMEHAAAAEAGALAVAATAASQAVVHGFPAFAATVGSGEIDLLFRDALARASDEPRIVVRIAPDAFEKTADDLNDIARSTGFAGKVITLEDGAIAPGDVKVEWADGGLVRDLGRLTRAIAEALAAVASQSHSDDRARSSEPQV